MACAVQLGQVGLLPVESGAAFREKEVEELAGGAAVTLTEGMGKVRVVVQVRDGASELSFGNIPEPVEPVDLSSYMGHRLADAARGTEGLAAFLDADCPHITRPDVHVLKELTVNRAQVQQIVRAVTQEFGGLTQFDNTCLDEIVLRVRSASGDWAPTQFLRMFVPGMK